MRNYIFKIVIRTANGDTKNFILIEAENPQDAQLMANVVAMRWWGTPQYLEEGAENWVTVGEGGEECRTRAIPTPLGTFTKREMAVLDRLKNHTRITQARPWIEHLIEELRGMIEEGAEYPTGSAMAGLFGGAAAARCAVELGI